MKGVLTDEISGIQSCMRCTASGRTCGGYEDGADRVFRQYNKQDGDSKDVKSTARKCSLPVRTNGPAADVLPQEITDGQVEEYALRAFFYDYCIVSTNRSLSRGYLDGLEKMVHQQGADSDLAKACKVVAFACQGIKLSRPTTLTRKAEMIYHDVLGSLAKVIANIESANVVESVVIAMLLGLYEVRTLFTAFPWRSEKLTSIDRGRQGGRSRQPESSH